MQRLGDVARLLMVVQRDGLAVEERLGIGCRVLAVDDGDASEILTRGAELVQVPLRDHGDERCRGRQPVRIAERVVGTRRVLLVGHSRIHLSEAQTGPLVERPIRHDDVGDTRGHSHRRLLHRRTCRTSAIVDAREVRELGDSHRAGDGDLRVGVHGETDQPVDIGGSQAGIGERCLHRLGCQSQFAAPGVLGELGGTDACDRGCPRQLPHQRSPHVSVTVEITCLPSALVPVTATVMRSSSTPVTSPVKVNES